MASPPLYACIKHERSRSTTLSLRFSAAARIIARGLIRHRPPPAIGRSFIYTAEPACSAAYDD